MTPSKRAKELGCKSLAELTRYTGQSKETLSNWHKNRPLVFDAMCRDLVRHKDRPMQPINGETKKLIDFESKQQVELIQQVANRKFNGNFSKAVRYMCNSYLEAKPCRK